MPPSSPGERDPKAPARVTPAPLKSVPPLPWSPRLRYRLFQRLTVRTDELVLCGPLLRRRYSWKAVDGVQRRGEKKVVVDLGHRGTRTFKYDGLNGRPTADQVAGVVERVRGNHTSALTSYRVSLSWGAVVFLPAVVAVAAVTAWALIKG
ncbi:hypothetical protein [Kribbella sp. NPDC051718]|uniref:hypothetical protein n=1 Tax=Kribbella sp. NPDC051718 TaxID=3155168 RepID=UPI0034365FFD